MYLYDEKAVFVILLVEFIITVVFIIMQSRGYDKLIRECEKGENDNIVIKKIKSGQVNVNSVDNFVNKYVSNFKFCGLKLYTIKKICGQLLNFVFITWCIVSIYGVYLEVSIKEVLWTTMLGILLVGGLFSIGHSVDNSKCEYVAMVNLKNILEEFIYFNDESYKVVYDSVSNEVTRVAYTPRVEIEEGIDNESGERVKQEKEFIKQDNAFIEQTMETVKTTKKGNVNPTKLEEMKKTSISEEPVSKRKDTPEAKRERLKNSVFASDDEKRETRQKKVELNGDNLGYLADY